MEQSSIKERLAALVEPAYRTFSAGLLPGVMGIQGVRLPELRALAKEVSAGDWRAYLRGATEDTFEEIMLQGMVIGMVKVAPEEKLAWAAAFVPKINNWSVCDSFCSGLKVARSAPERVWDFLQPYLASQRTYDVRFAVVMLLQYYIDEARIDAVLQRADAVRHEDYYVKMAVAWLIASCYIRFPERTLPYLRENTLDDFTYNKALQKITDSQSVDAAEKAMIRLLRRTGTAAPSKTEAERTVLYDTAFGCIAIAADETALTRVFFADAAKVETAGAETPLMQRAIAQIRAYLAGDQRVFDLPLAPRGTTFQQRVWRALLEIPYGETRSYKEIAAAVGRPKACRAVGMANHRNPLGIVIPCHRVIGANGALTGYAGGLDMKRRLLELEQSAMGKRG